MKQAEMERKKNKRGYGIIDCDVHVRPKHSDEVRKYLDPKWYYRFGEQQVMERDLFVHPIQGVRMDSIPPSGLLPGADPDFLREQLINEYGIEHVVITHRAFVNPHPNAEYAAAKAAAYNDWLAETWLGAYNHDGVFKGSIQIAQQDPVAAAREIERWAGHPHMVQVVADSGARLPFGNPVHDPIFEACQKHDLPFATHVGTDGMGINILAAVGYPSYYMEWTSGKSIGYGVHLVSMLIEGVFERFPRLMVALIEGGVAGYVPLLWRLDTLYERYRSEVPWLKRKPSEYVREHVRITSQPIERPDDDKQLITMLRLLDAEHVLMFATDYPHWDFDSPKYAFPKLPEPLHRRIFYENAKEFYKL